MAAIIAFALRFSDEIVHLSVPPVILYAILLLAIAGNEITMRRWRVERDSALSRIHEQENRARAPHQTAADRLPVCPRLHLPPQQVSAAWRSCAA